MDTAASIFVAVSVVIVIIGAYLLEQPQDNLEPCEICGSRAHEMDDHAW